MADGKAVISNSIPNGGEPGQVLKKATYSPYEVYWGDAEGGGGGSDPQLEQKVNKLESDVEQIDTRVTNLEQDKGSSGESDASFEGYKKVQNTSAFTLNTGAMNNVGLYESKSDYIFHATISIPSDFIASSEVIQIKGWPKNLLNIPYHYFYIHAFVSGTTRDSKLFSLMVSTNRVEINAAENITVGKSYDVLFRVPKASA